MLQVLGLLDFCFVLFGVSMVVNVTANNLPVRYTPTVLRWGWFSIAIYVTIRFLMASFISTWLRGAFKPSVISFLIAGLIGALVAVVYWAAINAVGSRVNGVSPLETANATHLEIHKPFEKVYNEHKDKLGQPKSDAERLELVYHAKFENAQLLWIDADAASLIRFHLKDGTWSKRPDNRPDDPSWYDPDANRKRLKTPKGKNPPFAGVAKSWVANPDDWSWMRWMEWHCYYPDIVQRQRFEKGDIIGPVRSALTDDKRMQLFVLFDDQQWERVESRTAEKIPCEDPMLEKYVGKIERPAPKAKKAIPVRRPQDRQL